MYQAWNIEKQHFHVTRYVEKRKSGASAFEEPTRDFSKKQKKRKLNVVRLKKENVDHAKSAIKQNQLEQRWESPRLKEYVEQTRDMYVAIITCWQLFQYIALSNVFLILALL